MPCGAACVRMHALWQCSCIGMHRKLLLARSVYSALEQGASRHLSLTCALATREEEEVYGPRASGQGSAARDHVHKQLETADGAWPLVPADRSGYPRGQGCKAAIHAPHACMSTQPWPNAAEPRWCFSRSRTPAGATYAARRRAAAVGGVAGVFHAAHSRHAAPACAGPAVSRCGEAKPAAGVPRGLHGRLWPRRDG